MKHPLKPLMKKTLLLFFASFLLLFSYLFLKKEGDLPPITTLSSLPKESISFIDAPASSSSIQIPPFPLAKTNAIERRLQPTPPQTVLLKNISVDTRHAAIILENKSLLYAKQDRWDIFSHLHKRNRFRFSAFSLLPSKKLKGRTAIISFRSEENYYHWMIEALPKIALLKKHNIPVSQYLLRLGKNGSPSSFQKATLKLYGLDEQSTVFPHKYSRFSIEEGILPIASNFESQKGKEVVLLPQKWFIQDLRERLFPEGYPPQKGKRLYISRKDANTRQVINEQKLLPLLKKHGFEVHSLEGKSLEKQALLLASASVIVAPHGAGLTNLIFCHPNTKVLELHNAKKTPEYFWKLSHALGLEHHCLKGLTPPKKEDKKEAILIDFQAFKESLEKLL